MITHLLDQQMRRLGVVFTGKKTKEPGFVSIVLIVRAIQDRCDASDRFTIAASNEPYNLAILPVKQAARVKEFADATWE